MSLIDSFFKYNPYTALPYFAYDKAVKQPMNAADDARANFDPYSGMPNYPGYINMEGGPTGQYMQEAGRAPGVPSPGAALAMKNQNQLNLQGKDMLKKQAVGESATAKNALAMKGGLNSGAAERINMEAGNRALELGNQGNQANQNNFARISMEDEGNRAGMLNNASGMQANEAARKNAYNMGGYTSAINAWAGNKQAQATNLGGKK